MRILRAVAVALHVVLLALLVEGPSRRLLARASFVSCEFCSRPATTSVEYRRGSELVTVLVCPEHARWAPRRYAKGAADTGSAVGWLIKWAYVIGAPAAYVAALIASLAETRSRRPVLAAIGAGTWLFLVEAAGRRGLLTFVVTGSPVDAALLLFWPAILPLAILMAFQLPENPSSEAVVPGRPPAA